MRKNIFALCLFIACFSMYAQEELIQFENDLKTSKYALKKVIPVINQKNDDVSLFIMDSKKVYGYLFNDEFKIINKLSSEDKSRKYKTLIGYSITNSTNYNIYLADKRQKKFAAINFSFDDNISTLNEFEIKNPNEKFVQTAVINNICYLVTIIKESSIFIIYALNDITKPKPEILNLQKEEFLGRDDKVTSLYKLLTITSSGKINDANVKKIDENTPNSIEVASEDAKLYIKDNKLVFAFDNNRKITQIITVDPVKNSYTIKRIEKPFADIKTSRKKTNSFINGFNIYTVASTKENFMFRVHDFESGSIVKELSVGINDSITFKNTPIIQEGGVYDNYRELEKTKKFLRKITSGEIGVSVYSQNENHIITLGSKKEIPRGGGMMMGGFGGIPMGTIGSVNVFFNPTYFAYNSYSNTKSTHIKCLFDADFNHITGKIEDNAFDKLKNFNERGSLKAGKTVFKYKNFFVLGNYITTSKTYILRKFED